MTRFKTHCCNFEFWGKNHSPFVKVKTINNHSTGSAYQCRNCEAVILNVVLEQGDNIRHASLYDYGKIGGKNE